MKLEYNITKKDYLNAIYGDLHIKNKWLKSARLLHGIALFNLIVIAATITSVKSAGLNDFTIIAPSVAALIFFSAASYFTNGRVKAKFAMQGMLKSGLIHGDCFGANVMEITEAGIINRYGNTTVKYNYGAVSGVKLINGNVAIYKGETICKIIPFNAFSNSDERNALIDMIYNRMYVN